MREPSQTISDNASTHLNLAERMTQWGEFTKQLRHFCPGHFSAKTCKFMH